jgi:hypothetical protein
MPEDELGIEVPDPNTLDLGAAEALEKAAEEVGWPVELQATYQSLRQVKPEKVVNAKSLGDLAFTDAEQKLADIVQVLGDLREEEWRFIPAEKSGPVVQHSAQALDTLRQMAALRSSQPDAQAQHDALAGQLESYYQFFIQQIRPICVIARVGDALERRRDLLTQDLSEERVTELQGTFKKLQAEVEEFKSLSDLVSSQRRLVGQEGVSDLSAHFTSLVNTSKEEFKKWAWGLVGAVVLGGGAAVAWVYLARPADDARNAEIVTHIALDVLVVGLVVFLIRFFAIQARAHRHVEFVSRNKANALSTFNLIVSGQEDPAVRAQVASVLAQAVFKSDDGIFSDASSDSVTIIERVIGAVAAARPSSG